MHHRHRRALAAAMSVPIALSLGAAVAHADSSSVLFVNNNVSSCTDTGSGAGSSATPFCTIQAAANAAEPGDNVEIAGGDYTGPINITSRGTAAAPIVFEPEADAVVQIGDDPGQGAALTFDGASYVSFDGEEGGHGGSPTYDAPSYFIASVLVNDSSNVLLTGINSLASRADYAVEISGTSAGVSVTDSNLGGPKTGVLVGAGSSGDVISTNEIANTAGGIEVEGASNTEVTSNTLWGGSAADDQIAVGAGASGTSIEDNIVAYPGTTAGSGAAISVDSTSTSSTTEDYNVVWPDEQGTSTVLEPAYSWAGTDYASQASFSGASGQGGHDLLADPEFGDLGPFADIATAPQVNSANSGAPGWLSSDIYGVSCSTDPDIASTGAGESAGCERGAVQQHFSTAPVESFTADSALSVTLDSSMSIGSNAEGGPVPVQQTPTPAVSYVINWGDGTTSAPIPASAAAVDTATEHTYATAGTYTVTDTAELVGGGTAESSGSFTTAGSDYTPVGPTRILNTRAGTGAPLAKVPVGSSITVQLGGVDGIPTGITAVALNLTVTDTTGSGFLSVVPAGDSASTSNVNYGVGQTVANSVIVPVSAGGAITVYNTGPSGSVDVIADISGYFSRATGNGYTATTLDRILNTSTGTGAPEAKVPANSGIPVTIAGVDSIPAGVKAVAVHVTVFDTTGIGWIAAEPDGAGVPGTSSVNYGPGQIVSNTVIVPVASDGKIELYNGGGTTPVDLIADVSGYFSPSSSEAYVPISPLRDWDSRQDGSSLPANGAQSYELRISPSTPYSAPVGASIITNLTVTDETTIGFITAYPYGTSNPGTSNLNYAKDQTLAGLSILKTTGADNEITVYNQSTGTSDLVLDVFGYFANS